MLTSGERANAIYAELIEASKSDAFSLNNCKIYKYSLCILIAIAFQVFFRMLLY